MLPLSSLSLSFPSPIVKPMDQGVNTGLSLLDGCTEIAITENKTKAPHRAKNSCALLFRLQNETLFFNVYFKSLSWEKFQAHITHLHRLCMLFQMLCYVMLCLYYD